LKRTKGGREGGRERGREERKERGTEEEGEPREVHDTLLLNPLVSGKSIQTRILQI